MLTATQVLLAIREAAREDRAAYLPGFYQVVPGGYVGSDRFLGCVVPDQRKVARHFRDLLRDELEKRFASPCLGKVDHWQASCTVSSAKKVAVPDKPSPNRAKWS